MPHLGGSRGHVVLAGAGTGPRTGGFRIGATVEESETFNRALRRSTERGTTIDTELARTVPREGKTITTLPRGAMRGGQVTQFDLDPGNLGGGIGDPDPFQSDFGVDDVLDLIPGDCASLATDFLRNACLIAKAARDRFGRGADDGLGDTSVDTVDIDERGTTVAIPQRQGTTVATQLVSGGGFVAPTLVAVSKFQCPRFGNGKIGILWQSKMDGTVTCLPRGVSGAQFGLQRLHKPGTKPLFTGGDVNCLNRAAQLMKVEKRIDKLFRKLGRKSR